MSSEMIIEVLGVLTGVGGIGIISLYQQHIVYGLISNTLAAFCFGYLGYISGHSGVIIAQFCYGMFSMAGIIKHIRENKPW